MNKIKLLVTMILSSFLLCSIPKITTYANNKIDLPDMESIVNEISDKLTIIGVTNIQNIVITDYTETDSKISVSWKCTIDSNNILGIGGFYYKTESTPYWEVYGIEEITEDTSDVVLYYLSDEYLPFNNVYDYTTGELSNPITLDQAGNIFVEGYFYKGKIGDVQTVIRFSDGILEEVYYFPDSKDTIVKNYSTYEIDGRKITISGDSTRTAVISKDGQHIYFGDDVVDVTTEFFLKDAVLSEFE